jgi:2'-5' RNA ligase
LWRIFVAVYPPPEWVEAARAALARLELPPHRLTPVEQVHLTVHFVGPVARREIDDVLESVRRLAAGVPAFALDGARIEPFPGPKARLMAVTADPTPELLEIRSRLVKRLSRNARTRPNDRFRPHLTLARFRDEQKASAIPAAEGPGVFSVSEIVVVRSVLGAEGAVHSVVERVLL